jgi:23S rRNA (guanosine2251-2'-O)-methyltransferase
VDPTREAGGGDSERFGAETSSDLIWGRHSSLAVLESGRPIHRIWCTSEMRFSPNFLQLLREAKSSGVLVEEVTWARLGQISGGAVHQGIVLQTAAAETLDLPSLIDGCRSLGEPPLLLAVDGLTDPHNLGAIVRSAEALGAHGLVLPQRRNAGLTGTVAKVAAGALENLPVARVVNLNRSLDALKQEGYRVVGLAGEGSLTLEEADLDGPMVIVTGSESEGLSLLTRRSCDQLVRIPLRGVTPSLNASVATALLVYEIARRGWMKGITGSQPAPRISRPQVAQAARPETTTPELDLVAATAAGAAAAGATAGATAADSGQGLSVESAGDSGEGLPTAEAPALAAEQPALASEQTALAAEQTAVAAEQPAVSAEQTALVAEQVDVAQKQADAAQKQIDVATGQPPATPDLDSLPVSDAAAGTVAPRQRPDASSPQPVALGLEPRLAAGFEGDIQL